MILGFFPKKAAFPPFFRHSRPEAGRAAVLKCAAFLPPKKLRQKEMSAGRRCSHSTEVRRAPSPLSLKTGEISARTRSGKEPGQRQYALPAREISSKAALWGGMGPVTVPGVRRAPSSLFLKTGRFRREQGQARDRDSNRTLSPSVEDFVKSRTLGRNGTRDSTEVRRGPIPKPERWILAKDQALP